MGWMMQTVRMIFTAVLILGVLSACVAQPPPGDVPTLAALPSATPAPEAAATDAPAVVQLASSPVPTVTASMTHTPQTFYAFNALTELVYVYDCPQMTCGIVATFNRDDPVAVLLHDAAGWSAVLLDDGAPAWVRAADLLAGTATPTASPGITRTPAISTTPTPSATRTPTLVWTLALPTTAVPTLGVDLSFLTRTLPPGVVRLPPGANNPDATPVPPTPRLFIPTPLRTFPATLTFTPSHTPSSTPTPTLGAPIGTPQPPPTLAVTPSPEQPSTTAPVSTPPGAGDTPPTATFGPPGGTPPPFAGSTPTTSGGPPGIISTPPGA
jgi:hypothetical protein